MTPWEVKRRLASGYYEGRAQVWAVVLVPASAWEVTVRKVEE